MKLKSYGVHLDVGTRYFEVEGTDFEMNEHELIVFNDEEMVAMFPRQNVVAVILEDLPGSREDKEEPSYLTHYTPDGVPVRTDKIFP